jgi:hypothetical protein
MDSVVVGYVVTGVIALGGIWGTLHATTKQIDGQKDAAREERQEKRLEASYQELLVKVGQADEWAYDLMMKFHPVRLNEPYPSRPDIFVKSLAAQGILSVYWSPRVKQLVETMRGHIQQAYSFYLRNHVAVESLRNQQGSEEDLQALLLGFVAEKNAISAVDVQIREQISAELNHKHDGRADKEP